jgi:hypothetical protein
MKNILTVLCLLPSVVFGADNMTRDYIMKTSILSYTGQIQPTAIWLSSISVESNPKYFNNASGGFVAVNPTSVVSSYDANSTRYNVSEFYKPNADRYKLITHTNGFNKGEIFSIGYDSGINSQKMTINSAVFLGYAKTMSFTKTSITSIGVGSWFGGSTSERPCLDSYDRQYSCRTLTSWSDSKTSYPKPISYIDIKHIWVFD